jgi:hypothetical protein
MIREPEVEQRQSGIRRWSVTWALFNRATLRSSTQRRLFLTRRGAERWLDSKRIKPKGAWHSPDGGDAR